MDPENARKVCRLIAGVVVVDDHLDDAENAMIDRMLARFGLHEDDRAALFPIVDAEEAVRELRALPAAAQAETFELLVTAVAADRRFADEERQYLYRVGEALGLSRADIDGRVQAALA
ncbi:MAG: hypothetical protein HY909_20220 [Deltaproteobacteria bacterium]|nr:hypothetical protein [Deltaproteobacteria bacterium]